MAIRFDAGARRSILAATIEAEKHGRSRPLPRDLLMGLLSLPESPVPAGIVGPGADARALIAAAMADTAAELGESPQDAERILQRAASLAADRGAPEVGMLDILSAALHGTAGATPGLGAPPVAAELRPSDMARHAAPASFDERMPPTGPRAGLTRSGIGYDSHRFGDAGPLVLGGILIPDSPRLVGHSDGDAIAHAITDAILGAAGAGDIGEMFADTDPANRGRSSLEMLGAAVARVRARGYRVHHVDVTVVAERPRIAPYRDAMRSALAGALGVQPGQVSVKGKTNEGMGWIGRGEGMASLAVATLIEPAE